MNASMYIELKKKHKQFLSFFLLSCEEFSGDINLVYIKMQCKTYSYKSTTFFTNCYILITDRKKRTANKLFLLKKCTDKHKIIIFTLFRVHQCKLCKI